jgi:2-dehydro-3-deoxyphosphooctonate aldolase (KDO 8-P synthase)
LKLNFQVGDVRIGSGDVFLIAGPCVIESEEHAIRMAEIIKGVTRALEFPFIFKVSYDKANRTSIRGFRGPGVKEGLRILKKIKDEVQLPVLTDVHEVADVAKVAEVADVLQIPAFLCRQTDLVVGGAGRRGRGRAQRPRRQYQERTICFALGHAVCGREVPRSRQHASLSHGARHQFRV